MNNQHYDLIIIGAGLVGTSLACLLQDASLNVLLLERTLPDLAHTPNIHSRPISLSHTSIQTLKTIGLWQTLAPISCPIRQVHTSEQGAFGRLKIKASEYNLDALGYVLPFDHLKRELFLKATQANRCQVQAIDSLTHIDTHNDGVSISIEQQGQSRSLTCSLLIGADGTHSTTRTLLNIPVDKTDHQENALTATLTLTHDIDTGYERFTDQGVVAILPRPNQQAGLVWTVPYAKAKTIASQPDQEILATIQSLIGQRIGPIQSLKRHAFYPLITQIAKESYRGQACLLGNAAHAFYPIAAQGFNLSLRDANTLASCIRFALNHGQLNDPRLLKTYASLRQQDQHHIQQLVGTTARLFELKVPTLKTWRGLSLQAIDVFTPAKNRLVKRALGISGQTNTITSWVSDE